MAVVSFYIRGKQNPSPIYLRFCKGKALDVFVQTKLYINPKRWDKKKQRVRNIALAKDKDFINGVIEKLQGIPYVTNQKAFLFIAKKDNNTFSLHWVYI